MRPKVYEFMKLDTSVQFYSLMLVKSVQMLILRQNCLHMWKPFSIFFY